LSIYNKTEKSSKSSDAVNIFETVFFSQNLREEGNKFELCKRMLFVRAKSVAKWRIISLQLAKILLCSDMHQERRTRFDVRFRKSKNAAQNHFSFVGSLQDVSSMTEKSRISQGLGAIFSTR
jgi:hypothetical protein